MNAGKAGSRLYAESAVRTMQVIRVHYPADEVRLAGASGRCFLGTPFVWQSVHLTKWILCGLWVDLKVVSMVSTSRPQFDKRGWQLEQEARVRML